MTFISKLIHYSTVYEAHYSTPQSSNLVCSSVCLWNHRIYTLFVQLFMGTVAFVFAPLAPLVSLAGAIIFWISSWVYKYQLMFVFVTQVETGGVGINYVLESSL